MTSRKMPLALLGGEPLVTQPWSKNPVVDAEEVNAATSVILSGVLSDVARGAVIGRMEDEYAAYFGTKYAVSFASGTGSMHGALFAVGVRPGTEVLVCAHNWISGIMSVFHAGGTPVLCDVKPGAFHIDAKEIERKITPNTRAVIVTHLWGLPADMDAILKVCKRLKLAVIEDVSHAHGGKYKGRYCGTMGDCGCFSLQGSKSIVAGEGGVMITNSRRYYQRSQVPGHHSWRLNQEMKLAEIQPFMAAGGMHTYRMATVAAGIATAQIKKLPSLTAARQANFDRLTAGLRGVKCIRWPKVASRSVRGWYGSPAFFDAEKAGMSRAIFLKACQAEGALINGEGYQDWSQTPLLQDMKLLSQLFVVRHINGVEFKASRQGAFPHYDKLRATMLSFTIPPVANAKLMDQCAGAVRKVLAQAPALRRFEKESAR